MKLQKLVVLSTIVGLSSTAVLNSVALAADGGSKNSNGMVEFYPNDKPTNPVDPTDPDPTDPVDPIDPTDPEKPVEPGTPGPLSIDFASSFDFGMNKITNADQTYFARAQKFKNAEDRPNYVQVSDNRGNNAGWTLTVKQNGDFKATTDTLNDTLTGAVISLADSVANSNSTAAKPTVSDVSLDSKGSEQVVMSAADKVGAGTWVDFWGQVETVEETNKEGEKVNANVTKAVSLDVPGSTPKDAVKYQTQLTWTLSDVPGK